MRRRVGRRPRRSDGRALGVVAVTLAFGPDVLVQHHFVATMRLAVTHRAELVAHRVVRERVGLGVA